MFIPIIFFALPAFAGEAQRYAVIDKETGRCVNVVLWDGNTDTWSPPKGTTAVADEKTEIYVEPKAPPEQEDFKKDITALDERIDALEQKLT